MAIVSQPKKTKTLVVKAGETGVIPSTAKIISVGISGNADAQSDCVPIEEAIAGAETYLCYEFAWEADSNGGGDSGSWEINGVTLDSIEVGDTIYKIETSIDEINNSPGLVGKIKQVVPPSIMNMGPTTAGQAWYEGIDSGRAKHAICFKALPSVAQRLRAKFLNGYIETEARVQSYYVYARLLSRINTPILGVPTWCSCPTTVTP